MNKLGNNDYNKLYFTFLTKLNKNDPIFHSFLDIGLFKMSLMQCTLALEDVLFW